MDGCAILRNLELQVMSPAGEGCAGGGILNPALHAGAANICSRGFASNPSSTASTAPTVKLATGKMNSGRPPSKQDSSGSTSLGSIFSLLPSGSSRREVTFPGIEVTDSHDSVVHPVLAREAAFDDDCASISSRGTSSTVGYRDSFGENEEGTCLLNIQDTTAQSKIEVLSSATSTSGRFKTSRLYTHHTQTSEADLQAASAQPGSAAAAVPSGGVSVRKRKAVSKKNFIIFEHNDEDTLI